MYWAFGSQYITMVQGLLHCMCGMKSPPSPPLEGKGGGNRGGYAPGVPQPRHVPQR